MGFARATRTCPRGRVGWNDETSIEDGTWAEGLHDAIRIGAHGRRGIVACRSGARARPRHAAGAHVRRARPVPPRPGRRACRHGRRRGDAHDVDRGDVGAVRRRAPHRGSARAPHARRRVMAGRSAAFIAPLRDNPGTVRLVCQIAEALLPEIAAPRRRERNCPRPAMTPSASCSHWCAITPACSRRAGSSRRRRPPASWRGSSTPRRPRARVSSPCATSPACPDM